ncbi:hypothetical protein QBC47DRAFT_424101 [Echria macrotheca]|uniref:Mitochondrial transcription factor 1 n=1 Tax=Echria macrotheca TaxID=438768 RepID=A0AAJ0B8B5_9PEZI|nr:hypothetical protein QBC47DRAFT_424101 [Echria macrotheca]
MVEISRYLLQFSQLVETNNEVAQALKNTGIWNFRQGKQKGDKHRVHITDENLCENIISYLKPSLSAYQGCDLLDMFPGAGVWSTALHDLLQPRSHILMEPEPEIYTPFLQDLLKRPGVRLAPYSGVDWDGIDKVLVPEYLPHQIPVSRTEPLKRNDTLLLTANLSLFPMKKWHGFKNVAQMVLYQLIATVRTSFHFHRYGMIRMLVWTAQDEKLTILPRNIQDRRRFTIEADLGTEWIIEVAGNESKNENRHVRDRIIDFEGLQEVLANMQRNGMSIPPGRESDLFHELAAAGSDHTFVAGKDPVNFQHSLAALRREQLRKDVDPDEPDPALTKRLMLMGNNARLQEKWRSRFQGWFAEYEELVSLYQAGKHEEAMRGYKDWDDRLRNVPIDRVNEMNLIQDNLRGFRKKVLHWDRRPYEPLRVLPTDFFPNVESSLLDIQPKSPDPLLLDAGPGSSRSGDYFETILRAISHHTQEPLSQALRNVWPGASEAIIPNIPSLRDPAQGGSPFGGRTEPSLRTLSESQMMELLRAFMEWPFRPNFSSMVGRVMEEVDVATEEDVKLFGDLN